MAPYDSAIEISSLSDAQKEARVKDVVQQAGLALRARHPWLLRQDAIGASIMAFAIGGMIASGWLYLAGAIPFWVCIPLSAWFASLTHELEHDLIHKMYFRNRPFAHNAMLALAWLARPSTINPWIRRHLHMEHHKHSGTERDREERGITNGEKWGLHRLLMVGDNIMAALLRLHRLPTWKARALGVARLLAVYAPLGLLNWGAWYAFLAFRAVNGVSGLLGHPLAWSAGTQHAMALVDAAVVVLVAPNVLRTFCLHFISSNMHYYGDVEDGNVIQQCQVLNAWWLAPLQLFCFNFGSTHGIHHFYVKEPFYVRQWTAGAGHAAMRQAGVRFNDFGTFRRANRRGVARAA